MTIKEFRENVRKCKTWEELFNFLENFNKNYGYGLTAKKIEIPFEDITYRSSTNDVFCAYYLTGGRTYKTIEAFANGVVFWNNAKNKNQHHFSLSKTT